MTKGYISAQVQFGDYLVILTGPDAEVWVGYGDSQYKGPIDGIEEKYPDLWKYLIENKFIMKVE